MAVMSIPLSVTSCKSILQYRISIIIIIHNYNTNINYNTKPYNYNMTVNTIAVQTQY